MGNRASKWKHKNMYFSNGISLDDVLNHVSKQDYSDYVKLTFRNGSLLDIISPLNSSRGNRATAGILDEFRRTRIKKLNFMYLKFT